MMRFTRITDRMREAVMQFCMEQECLNGYAAADLTEIMLKSAYMVYEKYPAAVLPVAPVYRYSICAGEGFTEEILPEEIKKKGIIYQNCVHLGSFMIDGYSDESGETSVIRGYDVLYDCDSNEVKLFYRITTSDSNVTTNYRIETEIYERFDFYEFIIDLSAQLLGKNMQGYSLPVSVKEAA